MSENRSISLTMSSVCMMCFLFMFGPLAFVSQAQQLPPEVVEYADRVLYNGYVLTMDSDKPPFTVAQAVAIRDGRIMAVGEDDRISRMAGPNTLRTNLRGKAVIPGIVDTHSHPNRYALRHYEQEVVPAYLRFLRDNHIRFASVNWETKETALTDLTRFAGGIPAGDWIYTTSSGNPVVINEITVDDLDKVSLDHPLYVKIGNAMWGLANTKLLDIVTETYGEKLPGIVKDDQGVPNGRLFGTAGTVVDQEILPQMPPEILAPVFKKELEEWVAIGVTTLSTRLRGAEITAHGQLAQRGELPLRLGYAHEIGRWNPFIERDLKRLGNLEGHGTEWLWMIGISVGIPDGVVSPGGPTAGGDTCTSMTKRQLMPGDTFPDGMCYWDQPDDPSRETVLTASRYGYRIAGTHTFGDKAFLMMLDAYEQANQENSILGKRFALEHGMMVSPEVIEQSAKLGVIWSLQPPMFYGRTPSLVSRMYGEEIAHRWVLPVKSLIDAGVRVTFGADTHNDPERHPMFSLEVLVTRKTHDGRVFGARESIDRSTALLMMTRWGAEYVLREKELGSLEVGKLADLAVLDKNPLDRNIADEDLSEIEVLATIIGGEVAYGTLDVQQ